jgi:hypothetical protein
MSESSESTWRRLAIEAPVIIVSILLAFAIDAWWDERGERQAEAIMLQRLQADFTELDEALKTVEKEHGWATEASLYFMNQPIGTILQPTEEIDRNVFLVFLASRTFNPGSGAIASFYNNGGGTLIQSKALADKILGWSGLVEELQEEEANLQKGVAERWSPFIASRVQIGPYMGIVDYDSEMPLQVKSPGSRKPLVIDEEFMNHVLDRYKWQQIANRDIKPVREAVSEILNLIQQQLNEH